MFMTWIHFYFRADPGSGPHQNDPKHCSLVFITGSGPVSLIPSGLDSTIPIEYPEYMHSDAKLFISSLLQVFHKYYRIFQNTCIQNPSSLYPLFYRYSKIPIEYPEDVFQMTNSLYPLFKRYSTIPIDNRYILSRIQAFKIILKNIHSCLDISRCILGIRRELDI